MFARNWSNSTVATRFSGESDAHIIFGKVPLAYVYTRTHTLPIILISKNHHEMVRPYTCAYRRTKQYCGVTHCSTEDADIIRITIMHFIDLTRARKRFLTERSRRLEISEIYLPFETLELYLLQTIYRKKKRFLCSIKILLV